MSGKNPEFEIQMGEKAGVTSVGIKPPLSSEELDEVLQGLPERVHPKRIINMRPGGNPREAFTLLDFSQPHFGKYRHEYAKKVVEALKGALSHNGTVVNVNEEITSLHGDNQLFE